MPRHQYIGTKSKDCENKENYYETIVSFDKIYNDKKMDQIRKPNYQGALLDEKVDKMAQEYRENPLLLRFKNRIIIGCLKTNWYVIDGQHRIEMARTLFKDYNIEDKLVFCWYVCSNEQEMKDIFISVNHDSIKNQFYVSSDDIKQIIKEELTGKLKEYNKRHFAKKKSQNGRIKTIEEFVTELDDKKYFNDVNTSQEAYNKLVRDNDQFYDINRYEINLQNNASSYFKPEITILEEKIVFSLKNNNFIDWVSDKKKHKPYHQNRAIKASISPYKKKKVWENEFGTSETGICPISFCSTVLKGKGKGGFQSGHIISEYNGGVTEPSNMRPICAGCNQSMGMKNWNEWDPQIIKI